MFSWKYNFYYVGELEYNILMAVGCRRCFILAIETTILPEKDYILCFYFRKRYRQHSCVILHVLEMIFFTRIKHCNEILNAYFMYVKLYFHSKHSIEYWWYNFLVSSSMISNQIVLIINLRNLNCSFSIVLVSRSCLLFFYVIKHGSNTCYQ